MPAKPRVARFADEVAWKEFVDRLKLIGMTDEASGEFVTSYRDLKTGRVYICELLRQGMVPMTDQVRSSPALVDPTFLVMHVQRRR